MYLRHSTVRKNGKTHTYWRLVRSVREGSKVRQETVANLGELDAEGRANASALAKHFLGDRTDQLDFFEDRSSLESVRVNLNRVRVERGRTFGDVWLGWLLWQALELDRLCADIFPHGRESVPWSDMVLTLVLARLCEPSSELHIAEQKAGLGSSPRTILEEFKRIDSVDVVLPVDGGGPELRLRCVVRPDKAQAVLLSRLGLTLPMRLRPNLTAKM